MIKTLLNRPLTVITIFLLFSITGLFMIFQLPLDLMPDMTPPYIFIQTIYPSAGPEEVEQEITEAIEDAVSNLAGLKNMTSTSAENLSSIVLEFTWGDDIDKVTDEVREKIAQIQIKLPEDAKEPIIRKLDPNMAATIEFSMQGDRNISELTNLAKDIVKPAMEQIPGIAKVDIQGSREELIKVSVNQNRMEAYNLSISQIAQALASQNMTLGAGKVDQGKNEFLIKTSGKYENIDQIKNCLVTTISDGTIKYKLRVRDLAEVYFTQAEENSRVRVNGNPGINLQVYKQSGTNTVEAAKAINKTIDSLKNKVPPDVSMLILKDSSKIIGQSLSDVIAAAITGIFCSILILLLFLRQVRSTAIVAISIPVSILITILGMSLGGKTFNIVALTGLTLGVGMIVDASIVILENIYHYRQQGARLHAASLFGTKEMVTPIAASILTSICVFLPILLFGGKIGSLGAIMNDMAFTVIVALTASLIVAVFLVPVLAGHFLPIHTREERPIKNPLLKKLDQFLEFILMKIQQGYEVLLKNALQHKFMTVLTVVLLFIFSIVQIPKLGIVFLPNQAEESVVINLELPVGTSLDVTKDVLDQLESIARNKLTGYSDIFQTAGSPDKSSGTLTITLPDLGKRTVTPDEIKSVISLYFPQFPDARFTFTGKSSMAGNMFGSGDINVKLKSRDLNMAISSAHEVKRILETEVPELTDVSLNIKEGQALMEIVINKEAAYDLGLSTQMTAVEIRNQLTGTTATVLKGLEDNYDVDVSLREEDKEKIKDLEDLFIISPMGIKTSVSDFASLKETTGPVSIPHENKIRTVTLSAGLISGASVNFVEKKIKQIITDKLPENDSVKIIYGGEMEDIGESGSGLFLILIFAILLVFGVMISLFENLKSPVIVLLSLPMLAIGVVGIYLILGMPFSMVSFIGVIMLSGIVVNNGIVLVDYTNLLRKRGMNLHDACIKGGTSRLRPILMTTLTTILAMVPLAFFSGDGGSLMQPLGITVVGGLTINTFITLIFVPVLYAIFFKKEATQ